MQKALALDVDGIEIDVFRCQSGEIVFFDDKKLNKLTNGKGKIEQKTWTQLQELQVMRSEPIQKSYRHKNKKTQLLEI